MSESGEARRERERGSEAVSEGGPPLITPGYGLQDVLRSMIASLAMFRRWFHML